MREGTQQQAQHANNLTHHNKQHDLVHAYLLAIGAMRVLSTSNITFSHALCRNASAEACRDLGAFLSQAHCSEASAWKLFCRAKPPRATVARIARRFGAALHETMQKRNYFLPADFRREARRIRKWYKDGRKSTRRRRGIVRSENASDRVRGLRSVWSQKVNSHYLRLLKAVRQEGLWKWRMVALALRTAGVPVQSGTIPVERLWASLQDMFPRAARKMSRQWFDILVALTFLRYNYRHFHHRLLPTWTEGDSLMAERIDNLWSAAKAMEEHDASDNDVAIASLVSQFL
jgi:hypothetical protein